MAASVERSAFRSLLRLSRSADRRPVEMASLLGRPTRRYHPRLHKVVRVPPGQWPFVDDAVWEVCGGTSEYAHPAPGLASSAIRRHRRRALALGDPGYLAEARELLERLERARAFAKQALGSADQATMFREGMVVKLISNRQALIDAFDRVPYRYEDQMDSMLGKLHEVQDILHDGMVGLSNPDGSHGGVWYFPPDTVSAAAAGDKSDAGPSIGNFVTGATSPAGTGNVDNIHATAMDSLVMRHVKSGDKSPLGVGDVLLAHPIACLFQPVLDQATVLIEDIDDNAGHVRGMVLNKPGSASLRQVLAAWPREQDRQTSEVLGLDPLLDASLHVGGDLLGSTLWESVRWLHTVSSLPGARELLPSLWAGGDLRLAASLIREGKTDISNFRPILGFAGWSRRQLELELERGVWVRVRVEEPASARALGLGTPPKVPAASLAMKFDGHGIATWRAALLSAGMPALSRFPRGVAVDPRLRAFVENHQDAQAADWLAKEGPTEAAM